MEEAFSTRFLAIPSLSSECFMTMTIDEDRIGQPLNLRGAFFEFIPSSERVEPNSRTLNFYELEEGENYEVIVTTLGGLYRYAMCDIFRVTGFVDEVPRLEYVGRRAVSDLTGEKLAEQQVVEALRGALAVFNAQPVNCTVCGIQDVATGRRPRYVLVLEMDPGSRGTLQEQLGAELDNRFKAINSRYAMKRNFHDLDPVAVEFVAPGTFAKYREQLIRRGMPAGQLKDRVLQASGANVLAELLKLSTSANG
jgi:hypothetical protein